MTRIKAIKRMAEGYGENCHPFKAMTKEIIAFEPYLRDLLDLYDAARKGHADPVGDAANCEVCAVLARLDAEVRDAETSV